ncbi:MAG: hypothetical protein J07HQW1_03437 [Haloquadratum walsbyi J07HQW1]|jgi:hypothetical protein|uniref:Uncharacterized protein n=1 Tax=Haloquadratum walsbyi J07HQW1 TaxID=1238424 RepID=U1PMD1_9EURY|nr:MAG: hypothetical protein J07HQW1_03437 [Haloquadratum walsbyi J07HQW1]
MAGTAERELSHGYSGVDRTSIYFNRATTDTELSVMKTDSLLW